MSNKLTQFIDSFKSLTISSIDENSNPFTSYAPFIKKDGKYYVYISSIARHSRNLTLNKKASLFFLEDEISCDNIFGRKRAVLQCKANKLPRDNEEFEELIELFEKRHGATVNMLKTMKDFSFFEFSPFDGEAVFGFGQAYNIDGETYEELLEREGVKGHNK